MASADVTPAIAIYGKPMVFYPNSHRYKYAGDWVPSVSSILNRAGKDALVPWAANQPADDVIKRGKPLPNDPTHIVISLNDVNEARTAHTRTKEAAGDVGTEIHDYAKAYMRGQRPKLPDDEVVIRVAESFRQWHAKSKFDGFQLERPIYSRAHNYAGTPDFWGKYNGELYVIDYKTSKGVYSNFWLQTMAYRLAIMEERGLKNLRRGILHMSKETGRVEFHDDAGRLEEEDRKAFLALVNYHKAMREIERREKEVWKNGR